MGRLNSIALRQFWVLPTVRFIVTVHGLNQAVGFETRSHGVRGDSEIYGGVYKVFASGWFGTLVAVDDSAESVDECDFMEIDQQSNG